MRRRMLVCIALAAIAACHRAESPIWFRADIHNDGVPIPFLIALPASDGDGTAEIANADERLHPAAHRDGDKITVDFPEMGNRLELVIKGGDKLSGHWRAGGFIDTDYEVTGSRVASPDPAQRYPSGVAPAVDVTGTWELAFDEIGPGTAHLRQRRDGAVTGTIIIGETGDARFLSGQVAGRRLSLSTFDGMRAYRFDVTLSDNGKQMFNGLGRALGLVQLTFHGKRGRDLPVSSFKRTRMRDGTSRITLAELSAPHLAGKPVIVDFFGTWCSQCIDLSPVLVAAYRRHHPAGLEILSIALEPYEREEGQRRIAAFRARYAIPWPIVHRVLSDGDLDSALPPELEQVLGFPVTVFIDRDGTVRDVHTGFVSEAAPKEHAEVLAEFDRLIGEIMKSPAPPR